MSGERMKEKTKRMRNSLKLTFEYRAEHCQQSGNSKLQRSSFDVIKFLLCKAPKGTQLSGLNMNFGNMYTEFMLESDVGRIDSKQENRLMI